MPITPGPAVNKQATSQLQAVPDLLPSFSAGSEQAQ